VITLLAMVQFVGTENAPKMWCESTRMAGLPWLHLQTWEG